VNWAVLGYLINPFFSSLFTSSIWCSFGLTTSIWKQYAE
jgi:hypothetical protein